jgi:iron complex transport system substrate-binding protein
MATDDDGHKAPTRRDCVKYGSTVIGGGLIAGCSGQSDSQSPSNQTSVQDESGTTEKSEGGDGSYTVAMAPAGEVTFDDVPRKWACYYPGYADMGVALGLADDMTGVGQVSEYYTGFYEELPGVSVDKNALTALWSDGIDKEIFYELGNDVHLISPANMRFTFDWSNDDLDEIRENVGPFIGNRIYRRSDDWHDHRYYSLYEAFQKVAQVFQREERYQAFKQFHDEFIANVQSRMPSASERPSVLLTYAGSDDPETFSPYRLKDKGTNKKQWRDLGVDDALAGTSTENLSNKNRNALDYENMLTVDPEVILIRGHEEKTAREFEQTVLGALRDHPVGSELTAVQNGRVYRGGLLWQGPIQNLFLTEQAAKQLYPGIFGDVTSEEKLFDRQRVADIINGNI